jgi:thiosulfate dehydrogenase [quinone] large subunit
MRLGNLSSMNERFPLAFLVPLRVLVGVILVIEGYQKFSGGWLHGDALYGIVGNWLNGNKTYDFFRPVIESARLHPKIFGTLITLGELTVGLSMLLGLMTRLGAVLGTLLLGSVAFGSGQGLAPPGNALLMMAIMATFVVAPPGRILGIDQKLRGRMPRWMV